MRISDWSSDVCSSDLAHDARMTRPLSVALPFAAALALGGCATAVPPVEVTRFHTNAVAGWAPGARYAIATAPLDGPGTDVPGATARSEEHTSELQSLMRISYAVFCLKKKNRTQKS